MRPLIGLTGYNVEPKEILRRRWAGAPKHYFEAIWKAGGTPVLIPNIPGAAGEYVERCDGFVLIGGGDIDPAVYTDDPVHETVYDIDSERDDVEFAMYRAARERRAPILGVCRGIQLINVAHGGTLYQDVAAHAAHAQRHNNPDHSPVFHDVVLDADSRMAEVMGTVRVPANSYHHQAVRELGRNLQPTGKTDDGLVEALEDADYPFLLAVQWHPELLVDEYDEHFALFRALVDAARG